MGFELYPGQSQQDKIKDFTKGVSKNTAEQNVEQQYANLFKALDDTYTASQNELTAKNRGALRRGQDNITALGSRIAPGGVMGALSRGYEEESDAKLRQAILNLETAKADKVLQLKMAEITGKQNASDNVDKMYALQEQKDAEMLKSLFSVLGTIGGAFIPGAGAGAGALTGIPELDIPIDFDPKSIIPSDFTF